MTVEMTLEEFVRLVWKMRDAQKEYFLNHTRDALRLAQNLERQVDAEVLRQVNQVQQPRMW